LFLPVEQLEGIVVMLDAEFGTGAECRIEEIRAEIAKVTKEIENMIAAIRASTFSQRSHQAW